MKNIIRHLEIIIAIVILSLIPYIKVSADMPATYDDNIEVWEYSRCWHHGVRKDSWGRGYDTEGQYFYITDVVTGSPVQYKNNAEVDDIHNLRDLAKSYNPTSSTKCSVSLIGILERLSNEEHSVQGNNDKDIDINNTFSFSNSDFGSELDEFSKSSDKIYDDWLTGEGGDYEWIYYFGCDYSGELNKYIYYSLYCYNLWGGSSKLDVLVFKSNRFLGYDIQGNIDTKHSSTKFREEIITRLLGQMDSLYKYNGEDVVAEKITGTSTYTDITGLVQRFNTIFRYNKDHSSDVAIGVDICDEGNIEIDDIGREEHPKIHISYPSDQKVGYRTYGGLDLVREGVVEGITFSGSLDDYKVGDATPVFKSLYSAISHMQSNTEGNITNVKDLIDKIPEDLGNDGETLYELIKLLLESAFKAVSTSGINTEPLAGLENESDPFIIMECILQNHINELCDDKNIFEIYRITNTGIGIVAIESTGGKPIAKKQGDGPDEYMYTLKDIWNMLTQYQKSVLSQEYNSKWEVLKNTYPSITDDLKYSFIHSVDYMGEHEIIWDLTQGDVADDIAAWKKTNMTETPSVTCVARNAKILTEYIIGTSLYGVGTGEDNHDIFDLYDETLELMGAAVWHWQGYEDIADMKYFSRMPKEVGAFGKDSLGYTVFVSRFYGNKSWDRVVALFFNVEYAFAVLEKSEYGEMFEATPKLIRKRFNGERISADSENPNVANSFSWLSEGQNLNEFEQTAANEIFANDPTTYNLFRMIIELHDMCELLDIKPEDWKGSIETYLGIYDDHINFFNALRNNPHIYAQDETGVMNEQSPLGMFFDLNTKTMSDQWDKGFSLSALYVPMETNLYDANSITFISDSDWVSNFYYRYAFYRKAVFINTDSSAIVSKAVAGSTNGNTKVCTLRDLINYDRDIILTVDDNFYNANQVSDIISRIDYNAVRQVHNNDETLVTEEYKTWEEKYGNWASGLLDLDAESILKTGATQYYSQKLASSVTPLGLGDESLFGNPYDKYVLSTKEIIGDQTENISSVLDDYEYSVKQSYGVVSAIYRNADLYNECLLAITTDNAIFKSSIDICKTPGTKEKDWISIYNYYMLANLENQMKNDTSSTLDLDSPIFCDLFGNIVTESGLVIIPAACNATLCGENWDPYTIGWSEYYNNGNRIPAEGLLNDVYTWLLGREYHGAAMMAGSEYFGDLQNVSKNKGGGYFSIDNSEVLVLRDTELTQNGLTAVIQFEMPNKNSKIVKQLFYDDAYSSKAKNIWSHTITNLIVEVLRGAPIEYIDYEYEGLSGNMHISKYGVYMAYKLEELMNSLVSGTNGNKLGGNSIVTMPNLAFVTGIEYIVLYVFKIMFALLIVALVVQLYLDATKNSLGVKSVLHFIFTCVLLLISFTLVPKLINWSYYKANKDLLADEAGYIMMLNYAKEFEGTEIGVTSITTPETQSELYVQVSDVKPNWWEIIPDVLFGNTFKTVTEMYTKSLEGDALARQEYVQMKGDGLYIDVQDIFNSTNLMYTPSNNVLINYSTAIEGQGATLMSDIDEQDIGDRRLDSDYSTLTVGENDRDSVTSFVMPYYVILDQLVGNINEYNVSRGITAYSWGVGSNGHILTYDVLTPYLTSSEFLEDGYDILGLQWVLNIENPAPIYNPVISDDDELRIQESLWYPTGLTNSMKVSKLNELYDYARDYIADNRHILGKVPDEVFIKVFAMQLATKYNDIFNISQGAAIEIINVDTRDLMRFMVGDKANVYRYYSYSFARYCYEEGGSVGTVFAALLIVIFWMTSFLKPLSMIIILALLVTNVVFRKLLFRKESKCVEGYLIGAACLCGCNYLYALFLKVSMMITDFGLGTITAMVIAFIVQILYVAGLLGIVSIELKDWRNSGFHEWQSIGANITSNMLHAKSVMFDKLLSRSNEAYKEVASQNKYLDRDYDMTVDSMLERDAQREQNALNADD